MLHGLPVAVEIDVDIFVPVARNRLGVGDEAFADVARALPDVGMNVDDR
jgi:hypothetical protein